MTNNTPRPHASRGIPSGTENPTNKVANRLDSPESSATKKKQEELRIMSSTLFPFSIEKPEFRHVPKIINPTNQKLEITTSAHSCLLQNSQLVV
jgi:hypothetical protein